MDFSFPSLQQNLICGGSNAHSFIRCGSGGGAADPSIARLAVCSPAHAVDMSKCPLAKQWTPNWSQWPGQGLECPTTITVSESVNEMFSDMKSGKRPGNWVWWLLGRAPTHSPWIFWRFPCCFPINELTLTFLQHKMSRVTFTFSHSAPSEKYMKMRGPLCSTCLKAAKL